MLYCCNVGDSVLIIKPGYEPSNGLYKVCHLNGENEVIVQNGYVSFIQRRNILGDRKELHKNHGGVLY